MAQPGACLPDQDPRGGSGTAAEVRMAGGGFGYRVAVSSSLFAPELGELLGLDRGVVAVAVVEQHVGLLGVAGQGAHLGRPIRAVRARCSGSRTVRGCPCCSSCPSAHASGPRPGRTRWRPVPEGWSRGALAACLRTHTPAGPERRCRLSRGNRAGRLTSWPLHRSRRRTRGPGLLAPSAARLI